MFKQHFYNEKYFHVIPAIEEAMDKDFQGVDVALIYHYNKINTISVIVTSEILD